MLRDLRPVLHRRYRAGPDAQRPSDQTT
jgi:MFS family permease